MPADVVARLREKIADGDYADNPKLLAEVNRRIAKYEQQVSAQRLSGNAPSGLAALESNQYFQQEQAQNPKTGALEDTGEPLIPGRDALDRRAFSAAKAQAVSSSAPATEPGAHAPPQGTAEHFMDAPFQTDEEIESGVLEKAPWEQQEEDNRRLALSDAGLQARGEIPTKSQSTNPALLRPPEFKPEGSLTNAALPGLAPGFIGAYYRDQTMWHEPSPEEFREVVRPLTKTMPQDWLDERVTETEAYKRYADARWAEAYDKAKAEGRPIVRISMQGPWAQRVAGVNDALASFTGGADEGLGAGLTLEATGHGLEALGEEGAIDALRAQRGRVPAARMAGALTGAVAPYGVGGLTARAGLKAAAATGLEGSIGREAVRGLIGGAVGGAGQAGAEEAVRMGSDVARGLPVNASDLGDAAAHVGMASLAGGAGGSILGGLAGGAGRFAGHMRNASPMRRDIRDLEAGGGKVTLTGGIEEAPEALALRARANAAPLVPEPRELVAMESEPKLVEAFGRRRINEMREAPDTAEAVRRAEATGAELRPSGDIVEPAAATALRGKARELGVAPGEVVADELVQPLARAHLQERDAVLKPLAEQRAAYHQEMRSTYVPATEYARAVYDNLQKRLLKARPGLPGGKVGTPLPEADVGRLKAAWDRVFIPRQVPRDDVEAAIAKGWLPVTSGIGRAVGMPKAPGFLRFVEPVRMNPSELEETLGMLARRAGHKTGSKPTDPVDLELDLAARKVRDRFPTSENAPDSLRYRMPDGTEVKGYSALNAQYAEASRNFGDRAELAGLPREYGIAPQPTQRPPLEGKDWSRADPDQLLAAAQRGDISAEQWDELTRGMYETRYTPYMKRLREKDTAAWKDWQVSPFQRFEGDDAYMELIRRNSGRSATDQGIGTIRRITGDAVQALDPGEVRMLKDVSRDLLESEGTALSPREVALMERLAIDNPTDVAGGSLYSYTNMPEDQLNKLLAKGSVELRNPMTSSFDEHIARASRRTPVDMVPGEQVLLRINHADRAYSLANENISSGTTQMVLPPGTKLRLLNETVEGDTRILDVRAETAGVSRQGTKRAGKQPEAKLTVPERLKFRERVEGYPGKGLESNELRGLAGRAGRGADLDTLEGIGAVDKLQGKIVTPANRAELKEGFIKYRRAADRTEKDSAFRELVADAGLTQELDNLASVNAADSLRQGSKVNLGFGITPSGAYPRAGGSVGNRAKLALYGLSNQMKKPFVNQSGELQVSDRLRALLHAIRLDPRAGQMARQGILPRPSDYSAFGMAGGGLAARAAAGAVPQGMGETAAQLSEQQVQAILESDEDTSEPVTPEEMLQLEQVLADWRRSKEQRP
jgi:hypothetical protein